MRNIFNGLFILILLLSISGCSINDEVEKITIATDNEITESIEIQNTNDSSNNAINNIKEKQLESVKSDDSLFKVVRVVDGDTIIVDYNGLDERVRLIGVDTPESVHSDSSKNTKEGILASDFTKELLEGKSVSLEFDIEQRDRYGRLLAYVYLDTEMVNKILLKEGYAQVATYPPNVAYVDDFTKLQRIARENQVGLWGITKEETTQNNAIVSTIEGDASEHRLIGSLNSNKYHKEGYTHNGKIAEHNLVYFESVEDAVSKGYEPCKVCFK